MCIRDRKRSGNIDKHLRRVTEQVCKHNRVCSSNHESKEDTVNMACNGSFEVLSQVGMDTRNRKSPNIIEICESLEKQWKHKDTSSNHRRKETPMQRYIRTANYECRQFRSHAFVWTEDMSERIAVAQPGPNADTLDHMHFQELTTWGSILKNPAQLRCASSKAAQFVFSNAFVVGGLVIASSSASPSTRRYWRCGP